MISSTDGWAVGSGGSVIHWNGTAWSSVVSPTADQMNGLDQVSSSEAFAVGNGGVIWHYGSHYRTSGDYVSRVFDAGASVSWGHLFWNELLPDGTDLTIATRTGNTPVPDGTWSAWSTELTDPNFAPITSPAGRYFQYRAIMSTTDQFATPRLNSVSIYFNEPAGGSFFDIKVIGLTDGWAVGQGGQLARFNGIEWQAYTPSPTASSLLDVDFTAADDVWAVGAGGTIVHWNGTAWSAPYATGTTRTLSGVDALTASDAFAVGLHGVILRWNGTNWSGMASPTIKDLYAVSCVSSADCWAAGANGVVLRWNGTAWSIVPVPTTSSLNGIFMWDADTGYLVGAGGVTLHWNGAAWVSVASTSANELRDVWCSLENDCWAWGVQQTFIQWDGVSWSQYVFSNPSNPVVQGGYMTSITDGWAVGEGGAFYHYTAVYPSPADWVSPVVDGGAAGIHWNTISWDSLEPAGTGVQAAVRTGPTPTPDASWSAWSPPLVDKGGSFISSPDNQYLQYRIVFTTTVSYSTALLQEVRIIDSAATGQYLYDVDGIAIADVWSVGRAGVTVHYDGTQWSKVASPTSNNLNGVDQLASDLAFAVGNGGTFLRWDGFAWNALSSPTAQDMNAISLVDATFGAAVGTNGAIVHWNGTAWGNAASPVADHLRGVHLYSSTLGYAVGDNGRILAWDGVSWSTAVSPTANRLNAVHLISPTLGWAVGNGGVIVMWDGASWSTAVSPVVTNLNAVESRSSTEAWIGGDFGLILQYDGASWMSFTSPTTRNLYGITVEAPTDGWLCGAHGSLLKDPGPYAAYGTFLSSVLDSGAGPSVWDVVFYDAALPPSTTLTVALRSGDTAVPDVTWSGWSAEIPVQTGAVISLPAARYLQYRAILQTADEMASPALDEITVTYRK